MLIRHLRNLFAAFNRKANMEVTKSNFAEKLAIIEKAIEEADFLAIDGEFTGLSSGGNESKNSTLDTAADRYAKNAQNVNKFLLVQFGICTFHYDAKKKVFTNRAFNFYVWPRPYMRIAPDVRFMCQTSSIDFLIQQNFDFNKLFKVCLHFLQQLITVCLHFSIKDSCLFTFKNMSALRCGEKVWEIQIF